MLETNGYEWGDKVQIFGFSMDREVTPVKKMVDDKLWDLVQHYHVNDGVCRAA